MKLHCYDPVRFERVLHTLPKAARACMARQDQVPFAFAELEILFRAVISLRSKTPTLRGRPIRERHRPIRRIQTRDAAFSPGSQITFLPWPMPGSSAAPGWRAGAIIAKSAFGSVLNDSPRCKSPIPAPFFEVRSLTRHNCDLRVDIFGGRRASPVW